MNHGLLPLNITVDEAYGRIQILDLSTGRMTEIDEGALHYGQQPGVHNHQFQDECQTISLIEIPTPCTVTKKKLITKRTLIFITAC